MLVRSIVAVMLFTFEVPVLYSLVVLIRVRLFVFFVACQCCSFDCVLYGVCLDVDCWFCFVCLVLCCCEFVFNMFVVCCVVLILNAFSFSVIFCCVSSLFVSLCFCLLYVWLFVVFCYACLFFVVAAMLCYV